jgi:hypothetical protein
MLGAMVVVIGRAGEMILVVIVLMLVMALLFMTVPDVVVRSTTSKAVLTRLS